MMDSPIVTKKQLKEQEKVRKYNEKMRQKNGSTEATDLYKLQKKIKKPFTFNKFLLYILILIVLIHAGLFLGFIFTVDYFNFFDIYGKMFEAFGLPNIVDILFK